MKKRRFTEQQIIGFLKEAEAGVAVKTCVVSTVSAMRRSTIGGRNSAGCKLQKPSAARLEAENAKLKKLLAEVHLDVEALKVAFGVKR